MKYLLTFCVLIFPLYSPSNAGDSDSIVVIDSSMSTQALLQKPGTYLGEKFTFEQRHSDDVVVKIGVWEAGVSRLNIDDFPFTEYVLMISGEVEITEKNGESKSFKKNDTFVIPKGWSGVWDIKKRMKKQIVRIGSVDLYSLNSQPD